MVGEPFDVREGAEGGEVSAAERSPGDEDISIGYAERLDQIGAARSVGSKGYSFDNAAAESLNSLCKKELIDFHGGWENVMDVTIATMEWVAWHNTERIHSYCGNIPPREYEDVFHRFFGTVTRAG